MDVIGAGFGRTGTLSFKVALEQLGFAPCYHMEDTVTAAGHLDAWSALASGGDVDWRALFDSYRATADFPACLYYREQLEAFPTARVVLTVREPSGWAASVEALRAFNLQLRARPDMQSPTISRWGETIDTLVWDPLGDIDDLGNLERHFENHIAAVCATVPSERLLVFDVRDGWAPMCEFLDVPVPTAPFPHANERGALDDMLATTDTAKLRTALRGSAERTT